MRVLTGTLALLALQTVMPVTLFWALVVGGIVALWIHSSTGMSLRRKAAIASWTAPQESNIYAKICVDMTEANAACARVLAETGKKVTVTHFVGKALAAAMEAVPVLNGRIVFGKWVANPSIDICYLAVTTDEDGNQNLAYKTVTHANEKSVTEIADELGSGVARIRANKEDDFKKNMDLVKALPTFLLHFVFRAVGMLSVDLAVAIPAVGLKARAMGGALITNVGVFGVEEAYAPLTPFSNQPVVVLMGAIKDTPVVVDGEVVIRPMCNICATMDHRYLDGADGARASGTIQRLLESGVDQLTKSGAGIGLSAAGTKSGSGGGGAGAAAAAGAAAPTGRKQD